MTIYPVGSLTYEDLPGDEYLYGASDADALEDCETFEKLLNADEISPAILDQEFIQTASNKKLGPERLSKLNLLLGRVSKRAFNIAFWDTVAEGELDIARALLESHRKLEITLETVDSCLQFLIVSKKVLSVKFLLSSGMQNEIRRHRIGELFESAIFYGCEEIQSEMLDRCQGKIPIAHLNSRLFYFASQGKSEMVQKVLDCYAATPPSKPGIQQLITILENPIEPNDQYGKIIEILKPYAEESCCTIL